MRIGTWNLDGRWGSRHADLLASLACDILLLTEVSPAVEIPGFAIHATCGAMARGQRWAAVAARDSLLPLPDPHVGTAMAQVGELRVCSSILPWRDLRWTRSWPGTNQAQKTSAAVAAIEGARPTVWGGDWNHSLYGTDPVGTRQGRQDITTALRRLALVSAVRDLPTQSGSMQTIDHVAIPASWQVRGVDRISAHLNAMRLSDHDAYVVATRAIPEVGAQQLGLPGL